jgi:hypothetical protein
MSTRGRPWPTEEEIQAAIDREARFCANCWWRHVVPGDGLCEVCRPLYERHKARQGTEQTPAEQDAERAPLSSLAAPVSIPVVRDPHSDWDCPCDRCENARRRALARAFGPMPGLAPKDRGGIE